MKIAIFSDCYLDLTGGIVTAINAEKRELERRGHTVYIFSSSYPKTTRQTAKFAKEHIFPVPSCRFWFRSRAPIARRPKIIENWLETTHPELKDFDIIYVHYEAGASIAGLRFAKKHQIPAVQVMHGREDAGEEALIPRGLRTFVAANLNWFHSWYLPHPVKVHKDYYLATTRARAFMWTLMVNHANSANLVITPSKHFADKLKHYGVTQKIITLPHGLSDELTERPCEPKSYAFTRHPLNLIWHSRVSKEKRIMPLLKALRYMTGDAAGGTPKMFASAKFWGRSAAAGPVGRYRLDVYGAGNDLKKAQRYAKKHHLPVVFRGLVPAPAIQRALARTDLDLLVSYDYDTFGMTLIEAATFGVPSLIADPDLAEALPKNSYLLAKDPSPAGLAAALQEVITNPEILSKLSQNLLKHRQNFQISRKIDKLERIFTDLRKSMI